jgi:hypothetical protein
MKYLFKSLETAILAEKIISTNMGYTLPKRFDSPRLIDNPEHVDYNKAFISEVEGDTEHHKLWMVGIDGVIPYDVVEYDSNWFLPEEL